MKTKGYCFTMLLVMLLPNIAFFQTDQENLDKYWSYRDRLRKKFLKIGKEEGESMVMSSRAVGYAFSCQVGNNDLYDDAGSIYYADAALEHGHYLVLLASEYKLTNNQLALAVAGSEDHNVLLTQKQSTLNELYYALKVLKRLDGSAEEYLNGQPNNENGFLLRDDVPKTFYTHFLNEH